MSVDTLLTRVSVLVQTAESNFSIDPRGGVAAFLQLCLRSAYVTITKLDRAARAQYMDEITRDTLFN